MNLFSCHPTEALHYHIPPSRNGEAVFPAITLLTTLLCINVVICTIFEACLNAYLVKERLEPSLECDKKEESKSAFALAAAMPMFLTIEPIFAQHVGSIIGT